MSNTKRDPLLSEDLRTWAHHGHELKAHRIEALAQHAEQMESARDKNAELIQQLVDALVEQKKWLTWIPLHHMDDADQSECIADGKRSDNTLSAAAAQGFTPTPET